jgi:hypothetical protein
LQRGVKGGALIKSNMKASWDLFGVGYADYIVTTAVL